MEKNLEKVGLCFEYINEVSTRVNLPDKDIKILVDLLFELDLTKIYNERYSVDGFRIHTLIDSFLDKYHVMSIDRGCDGSKSIEFLGYIVTFYCTEGRFNNFFYFNGVLDTIVLYYNLIFNSLEGKNINHDVKRKKEIRDMAKMIGDRGRDKRYEASRKQSNIFADSARKKWEEDFKNGELLLNHIQMRDYLLSDGSDYSEIKPNKRLEIMRTVAVEFEKKIELNPGSLIYNPGKK